MPIIILPDLDGGHGSAVPFPNPPFVQVRECAGVIDCHAHITHSSWTAAAAAALMVTYRDGDWNWMNGVLHILHPSIDGL